jgi:hypothetical protein
MVDRLNRPEALRGITTRTPSPARRARGFLSPSPSTGRARGGGASTVSDPAGRPYGEPARHDGTP